MASSMPVNARALAHQNDLQRTANPRLEVNERRLRPIYDYMEIHNYRKALTEIDRLLKKQSSFTACKALKCLVLLKLDRPDEARSLANELETLASSSTRTAPPGDAANVDENALTFLSQYYKDLREFSKVVSLYESAVKRDPTSEELLCSLFMAYVRNKDYKNQVLTAQKLYKLTRKIPYHNWAVISVLLQIDENSPQLKQALYIPMTLKMLEKEFFDESLQQTKLFGETECLLYLHTLELKEDFPKALQFLTKHLDALTKSPSNESMLPVYFAHEKFLIYNYKISNFEKTYQLAKEYLKDDNYLWNWYEVLFDSFFQFDEAKQQELTEDLHQFILITPDGQTDLRNVHLSRIELGLRWQIYQQKNPSKTLPQLALTYLSESYINHLTFYIQTYATKTTGLVMFDIYRAFEYLSKDQQKNLHDFLIQQITSEQDNIQYLINLLYCSRLCGNLHLTWLKANHENIIAKLNNQTSEISTEAYLLIINLLDEISRSSVDLYNFLDHIHEKDSANFDVKLNLYRLALNFNCPTMMKDYFERLEIKNIQYLSLSYLLTDHYLRLHRNYRQMRQFFQHLANILLVYTDDSWNQIMFCYKYGNFLRINEIRIFAEQYLNNTLISIQGSIGSLAIDLIADGNRYQTIGNILQSNTNKDLFEKFTNGNIQDTRDFDIWSKIDYRRLRFDENSKSIETVSYADRILAENSNEKCYQAPSYKDAFLRQYQKADFDQRVQLNHLRSNVIQLLETIYQKTESTVFLPNETTFTKLKNLLQNQENLTQSLTSQSTVTPCELRTIIQFELYQSIPSFIKILTDGLTINSSSESISRSNTTVHFDRIKAYFQSLSQQIDKSYELLNNSLQKTSLQKHCQENSNDRLEFLNDFLGESSPLEFYSVYTEFTSYIYCFYLSIKSIFASLFNKTSVLNENNDNTTNRTANTKKSKKKNLEQQTIETENENEIQFWNQLEKLEETFQFQWTNICENIRKYEQYLRLQGKLTTEQYERLERDLDGSYEQQSNKTKNKADENNNSNEPVKETDLSQFQLGQTPMRQSTIQSFALGYLESFIQIRVCLTSKQKSLRLRQTSNA